MVTRLLCAAVFAVFRDVFADSSHVETGSHYTQYIPEKYSDYVPEMDESGIKYQKYMQGQPDAMKFQEKVLPEGDYQHYIPLSQNGKADKHDALEVVLAAAKSEKKEDRKDRKTKDTDDSAERANGEMDFEKYMRAPTPGPVVDRKYGKYIPGKYSDYVPEMDESGIKYQKYMPESSGDSNRAGSFSRSNAAHEELLAETWNPSWMLAMFTMASGAVVLASVFARRPSPTPLGLQQPLTADDQQV